MPMLDVDGVGLAYDDVGRRDGVPLVFIHGWTANRHRWDDQLGHFAGRYRVISLDLRGHGDSDLTPDLYTIGGLAREVLALLDGLGVDRFVPVGHSMGGMIALTLALYYIRRSSYPLIGWLVDHVWATTSPTITWWAGRRIFVC